MASSRRPCRSLPSLPLILLFLPCLTLLEAGPSRALTPGVLFFQQSGSGGSGSNQSSGDRPTGNQSEPKPDKKPASSTTQPSRSDATSNAGSGRALTPEEKQRIIDDRLRESLQEFDGLLLKEKELLQEQRTGGASASATGGGGAAGGSGSGSAGQGSSGASSAGGMQGGPESNSEWGDSGSAGATSGQVAGDDANGQSGSGGRGNTSPRANPGNEGDRQSRVPPDIPKSGAGDDIVARQIREAAMSEDDPELREKLWDEYRKYKGIRVPDRKKPKPKTGGDAKET